MNEPLVSVIVPVYNAQSWLAETLDSVAAQTWPNTEVLLIDDGSTDASVEVAKRYLSGSVRLLQQENRGAAAARNAALRQAQGDYIQFLDADDVLHPRKLEAQVAVLRDISKAAAATCRYGFFDRDTQDAIFYPDDLWQHLSPTEWLVAAWSGGAAMPTLAWLASRSALDAAGEWNEALSLNDDGEFFTRVALSCKEIRFAPDATAFYRTANSQSLSKTRHRNAMESLLAAGRMCAQRLLAHEDSDRSRLACGRLLASVARQLYPAHVDLANVAEASAKTFLRTELSFETGALRQNVERLLGWRAVVKLRGMRGMR